MPQSLQGNANGLPLASEPRNLSSSRPQPGDATGTIIWALQLSLCSSGLSWHENKYYISFTERGGYSTPVVPPPLSSLSWGFLCAAPGIRHPVTVHGSALQLCLHYVGMSGGYPHRLDELHRDVTAVSPGLSWLTRV